MDKNQKLTEQEWIERYNKAFEQANQQAGGKDPRWQGVTCPGPGKCVLCDLTWPLKRRDTRDSYTQTQRTKANQLFRQFKYFSNVILKTDPKKVVIFEYPKTIFKALYDAELGKDEGGNEKFYSLAKGKNVVIIKQGEDRQTEYQVRFKDRSPIPEAFFKKVYDLDNVLETRRQDNSPVIRASQLSEGPSEMRILPNWRLGEKVPAFFFEWVFHNGLTPEEFNAIQRGEHNPYEDVSFEEKIDEEPAYEMFSTDEEDVPMFADDVPKGEKQDKIDHPQATKEIVVEKEEPSIDYPACFGHWTADDEECGEEECPYHTECKANTK